MCPSSCSYCSHFVDEETEARGGHMDGWGPRQSLGLKSSRCDATCSQLLPPALVLEGDCRPPDTSSPGRESRGVGAAGHPLRASLRPQLCARLALATCSSLQRLPTHLCGFHTPRCGASAHVVSQASWGPLASSQPSLVAHRKSVRPGWSRLGLCCRTSVSGP